MSTTAVVLLMTWWCFGATRPAQRPPTVLVFGDSFAGSIRADGSTAASTFEAALREGLAGPGFRVRPDGALFPTGPTIRLVAVNGLRLEDARPRFLAAFEDAHPALVVLWLGVNDLNTRHLAGVPFAIEDLRVLVRTTHAHGVPVLVIGLPPQRPGGRRAYAPETIAVFNETLGRCRSSGSVAVWIPAACSGWTDDWLDIDGLHLTDEGYHAMGQAIAPVIAQLLAQNRGTR